MTGQSTRGPEDSVHASGGPAQPHRLTAIQSSVVRADHELRARLDRVEAYIQDFVTSLTGQPAQLYEAAAYLLKAGGKRVRPLVLVLSCEAVGGTLERALPFALATELFHTASLLHDDIVDDDETRRGVATGHHRFGRRMAVIAGDLLVAHAIRTIGTRVSPELIVQLGECGIRMCEGEAVDLLVANGGGLSMSSGEYLQMIGLKTASFMREAARVGAVVGGGSTEQQAVLADYGQDLGYAFQIRDDILNVSSSESTIGKPVLTDLMMSRGNILLVRALEAATTEERQWCIRALGEGSVDAALQLIERTGAVEYAQQLADSYVTHARHLLESVELAHTTLLARLADFVTSRTY